MLCRLWKPPNGVNLKFIYFHRLSRKDFLSISIDKYFFNLEKLFKGVRSSNGREVWPPVDVRESAGLGTSHCSFEIKISKIKGADLCSISRIILSILFGSPIFN